MADTWACADAASADTLPAFPFNTFNFLQRLAGVSEAAQAFLHLDLCHVYVWELLKHKLYWNIE